MELTVKNVRVRIVELRDKLNTLDGKGGPEGGPEGGTEGEKGGQGRGGGGGEGGEGGEGKGEAGQDDGAGGGAGAIASLGGAAAIKVRMDRLTRQTILLEQLKASVKAQGSALSSAGLAWGNDAP